MKNKLYLNLLLICTFLISLFALQINNSKLINFHADTANIRYISTAVGEDETSVGINYHVDIEGSYVKYSRNATLNNAQIAHPVEHKYSKAVDPRDSETGFPERIVCQVNLTGLVENAYYYYQVVAGDEVSSIHKFRTYSKDGTSCDIMFTTDLHSDSGYDTTGKGNSSLTNIDLNSNDIRLALQTGDIVDRGGYEKEWKTFFNGYKYFETKIQATIPGNHEYYHTKSGDYISPEMYNEFFNNPKNGTEPRLNSTYTFTYGNLRVIMIDTINRGYLKEQQQWFRDVMEANTSQWVIVGTHSGAISCGAYASDANWCANNWGALFEEYQVDLALSGHEHIYIRKDNVYKGKENNQLGITYLVGCAGSHKQYSVNDENGYVVYRTNYSSNIIRIRDDKLTCTLYDSNGNQTQYYFEINARRPLKTNVISDDEIAKAVKYSYDKENETFNLNWNANLYGNVSKISVEKTVNGNTTTHDFNIVSTRYLSASIVPVLKDYNYSFKINIVKKDGSIISKNYEVVNRNKYQLSLILNGGTLVNPENYTTYFDGAYTALPTPTKENCRFIGWHLKEDLSDEAVKRISDELSGDLTFYAEWEQLYKINFITNNENNVLDPILLHQNDEYTLPYLKADNDIFIGWHLNEDLSDQEFFNIKIENKDITVYGEWASSKPTTPPQDEIAEPAKKCKKKSLLMVELLSITNLLIIIIRKKK